MSYDNAGPRFFQMAQVCISKTDAFWTFKSKFRLYIGVSESFSLQPISQCADECICNACLHIRAVSDQAAPSRLKGWCKLVSFDQIGQVYVRVLSKFPYFTGKL